MYGLKQASHNWYEKLNQYLLDQYFTPTKIDPCILMKCVMLLLVCGDDCLILDDSEARIDVLIHYLKNVKEKYILTGEESIDKFLGISISKLGDNRYELAQPFLIEQIVEFIASECPTEYNRYQSSTPVGKPFIHKYLMGVSRKYGWNCRTAVGMIGYLQQNTRPDISMDIHQCVSFVNKPMCSHERAIIIIDRYFRSTKERGVIFQPDPKLGIECFMDTYFTGCLFTGRRRQPRQFYVSHWLHH